MQRLAERQLRGLSRFLGDLYGARTVTEMRAQIVAGLPRLIACGSVSYNEVDLRQRRVYMLREPAIDPKLQAAFVRHFPEHPGYRLQTSGRDARAVRLSDHISRRRFHRLGLYNEYYRHAGVEQQLTTTLSGPDPLYLAVALNRETSRDFTDGDVSVVRLVSDHLRAAHELVSRREAAETDLALALRGLDAMGRTVIAVRGGRPTRGTSARTRELFVRYFGPHHAVENGLPSALAAWVRHASDVLASPRHPMVIDRAGRRLTMHLHTDSAGAVLMLEEHATAVSPATLEALGLSTREAEVLSWVIEGKTDQEIASILGLSTHTVHHHLEHVYEKLGVSSRTAAAARALEASRTVIP